MHSKLRKNRLKRILVLAFLSLSRPLVASAMFACRLVPERLAMKLASPLGAVTRRHKKNVILSRAQAAIGGQSLRGERAEKFWQAHLVHVGRTIFETVYLYHLNDEHMLSRIELDGEPHLTRALEQGRGAVLFLNHFGHPGTIVASLGLRGYDLTIAGNAMVATIAGEQVELTYLERIVQRMFARGRVKRALLGDRLPTRLSDTLARNGLFGMFVDFPVRRKHNQLLAFGGAHMEVNLGPAILALRHRCPMLCVTTLRVGDNRHRVTIHPPMELPATNDEPGAAQIMEMALQPLWSDVHARPEQWWPWDWAEIVPAEAAENEDAARTPAPVAVAGPG